MGVAQQRWQQWLRSPTGLRWAGWVVTALIAAATGLLVLSALRQYPAGLHSHFASTWSGLRYIACFLAVLATVALVFRLLSPQWSHLKQFGKYPPYWSAVAIAAVVVCAADLILGPDLGGYRASIWEWVLYAGGPVAIVVGYRWLTAPDDPPLPPPPPTESIEELVRDWPRLERWLQREIAAEDDLLGNWCVAQRLAYYLLRNGGTIGLVGPFGCGKTSVVKWLVDEVKRQNQSEQRKVWICEPVSCWGFEDPASAIQQILSGAVRTIGRGADCFSVRHLPEAYRKTFSAGGDWVRSLADLVLGASDPTEQFNYLSGILKLFNARLVIVIEDLDRTNSTRFDRQEVLALLQRLKANEGLSFVLTGGPTPNSGIDFARLCDHIELLREFEPRQVATIVQAVRDHCMTAFADDINTPPADPWGHNPAAVFTWRDVLPLSGILVRLLRTPRALKHALRRTYRAWERLHGEVDCDHLLGVNVLREGAPEAFSYVLRNWDHLRQEPPLQRPDREEGNPVSERLRGEWEQVTSGVEWDAQAATTLLTFLLPAAGEHLEVDQYHYDRGQTRAQGITERDGRYWRRIVNEEIEPQQERDQVVLREMRDWLTDRNPNGALVEGLVREQDYAGQWEHFSAGWDGMTLLCLADQVLARFRDRLGTRRIVSEVPNSPAFAFAVLWRHAHGRVQPDEVSATWLEEQIRLAMPHSLTLVLDLYHYWASLRYVIIPRDARPRIRGLIYRLAQERFRTGLDLIRVAHPDHPYDLHGLVFPHDDQTTPSEYRDPQDWAWLGPIILEALRREPRLFAPKVAHLISEGHRDVHSSVRMYQTIPERLHGIFGHSAHEVLQLLALERDRLGSGAEQEFLNQVIQSADNPPSDNQPTEE